MNEGGVRGDRSETFNLVSWFPPFMHRPVTFISNTLYGIFVKVGVIEPWHYSALGDVELGVGSGLPSMNVGISGTSSTPTGTRAEAERRRAMALKALDQRVKAGTQGNSNSSLSRSNSHNEGAPSSNSHASIPSMPPVAATGDSLKTQTNGRANVPQVKIQMPSPNENDEAGGDIGAAASNAK
jgi:hypothetical protein